MTKQVKEFILDQRTGQVDIEYDDNSVSGYNLANTANAIIGPDGSVSKINIGNSPIKLLRPSAISFQAQGLCGVFDVASLFSDETASVGTWKDLSNTTDGTHPNATGSVLLTSLAIKVYS